MTARNQAMMNRVADALLTNLQAIGMSAESQWLTKPKAVQRGLAVDVANLPKPGLFLMSRGWGPNTPYTKASGNLHARADARFDILCICDQPVTSREAEQELNNLASDVIDAIYLDYQLGTLLQTGYITVTGYEPQVELSSDRWAVAVVEVFGTWLWDTDSP